MYLAWFDANPKKPTAQKIAEAHQRYVEKFGRKPRVCLVNPNDVIDESAVELRPLTHISRNCFWIGVDDADEIEQESPTTAPARTPRKPKSVPAIEPIVAAAPAVAAIASPSRKPKAAPVAPPVPVVIPDPTIVPEPKRRTRREKAAA